MNLLASTSWPDEAAAAPPSLAGLGLDSAAAQQLRFEPGADYDERLARVQATQQAQGNAFLEAAAVLLRSLGEMPRRLDEAGLSGLHELLTQELKTFTRLCEQANLRRDQMLVTRYALCTALDEAINLSPTAGGAQDSTGMWSTVALLNTFHGESHGGKKVFLIIGRLAASPDEHVDVLELMHHLLCLGFMGDYRVQAEGRRHLETIRHRLHVLVSARRPAVARELSPHRQGAGRGRLALLRTVPVWVSASLLGLALFGLFAWHKYQLLRVSQQVQERIAAIDKIPLSLPAARPSLTLADLLADQIQAGRVAVTDEPKGSLVVFRGDGMFSGGLATLSAPTQDILRRVAQALNGVPGSVSVVGHTDNVPVQSPQFANNQALSEGRAAAVRQALVAAGVEPQRISVSGRGDQQPVQSNATAEGRARNRRVEIQVLLEAPGAAASAPAMGASAAAAVAPLSKPAAPVVAPAANAAVAAQTAKPAPAPVAASAAARAAPAASNPAPAVTKPAAPAPIVKAQTSAEAPAAAAPASTPTP
ncbi:type VI secretion system protein TssL, long form [Roseateles sp. BYS180W]|uniref:Type VI secretion system protein TssL, long form n=1 Tax=Roseateles rivi TaxID=3299028 RepID=A0ABW7FSY2_9BURK